MKKSFAWFLAFAPAAALYACGGSDNSAIDGGNDATTSDSPTADSSNNDTGSMDSGGSDSMQNNDGNNGMDAGKDVVVSVACRVPADCVDGGKADAAYPPPANDVCCATVTTGGTGLSCTLDSITTACTTASACMSAVGTCPGTDTVRGCAHSAECIENNYDKCCTVTTDAGSVSACMSTTIAGFLKATCLP